MFFLLCCCLFVLCSLTGHLGLTSAADAIDVECEAFLVKPLHLHGFDDRFDLESAQFGHFTAYFADLVTVVRSEVGRLVDGVLREAVAHHERHLEEQLHGIVECGPAHPEILFLHSFAELLQREMSCEGADSIENGITFGSFPQFMLIEIHGQDIVSAVAVIFHIHTT